MSISQTHIIAHHRVELEFQDRGNTNARSAKIMEACREHAAAAIEACCEGLIGPNDFVTIPYLELDLGLLNRLDLSADFLEKFKKVLRLQLEKAISAGTEGETLERALETVRNYGETGNYPWWAGSASATPLIAAFETLLESPESNAIGRLKDIFRNESCLERLALALPERMLLKLWERFSALQGPQPAGTTLSQITHAVLSQGQNTRRGNWRAFARDVLRLAMQATWKTPNLDTIWLWLQIEGPEILPHGLEARIRIGDAFVYALDWARLQLRASAAQVANLFAAIASQAKSKAPNSIALADTKQWLSSSWGLSNATIQAFLEGMRLLYDRHMRLEQVLGNNDPDEIEWRALTKRMGLQVESPEAVAKAVLALLKETSLLPLERMDLPHILDWVKEYYALSLSEIQLIEEKAGEVILEFIQPEKKIEKQKSPSLTLLQKALKTSEASPEVLVEMLWENVVEAYLPSNARILKWLAENFGLESGQIEAIKPLVETVLFNLKSIEKGITKKSSSVVGEQAKAFETVLAQPKEVLTWLEKELQLNVTQINDLQPIVTAIWEKYNSRKIAHNQFISTDLWEKLAPQMQLSSASQTSILEALWQQFREATPGVMLRDSQLKEWKAWVEANFDFPSNAMPELQEAMEGFLQVSKQPKPTAPSEAFVQACQSIKEAFGIPKANEKALAEAIWERFIARAGHAAPFSRKLKQWLKQQFDWELELVEEVAKMVLNSKGIIEASVAERRSNKSVERKISQTVESTLWIENAGLVLLWPFLERMLGYQGFVEDQGFVSIPALEKAVCLLQTVVAGQADWNEAALALPKILCGLGPDAIVDPGAELTSAHIEGAEQMVEAVLAHWSMAGSMSLDSFRAAWLQRAGTLRIRDDHWLLRIEGTAHDVLLEGLPWDIAYIQLPWMPSVVYVDWGEKAKFNG